MQDDNRDGGGNWEHFEGLGGFRRGQRGGESKGWTRYFVDYDRDGRYLVLMQEPGGALRPFGSGSSPRQLVDAALEHASVGDQVVLAPLVGLVLMAELPSKALEAVEAAGVDPFGTVSLVIPKFDPDSFAARVADLRKRLQECMPPEADASLPSVGSEGEPAIESKSEPNSEPMSEPMSPPTTEPTATPGGAPLDDTTMGKGLGSRGPDNADEPPTDGALDEALQIERWRAAIAKARSSRLGARKGGRLGWVLGDRLGDRPGDPPAN